MKNHPLLQGEPATFQAFATMVSDAIDELDGLVKATPMTLAEIGGGSGHPLHFETDGTHAYILDSSNHNNIAIVNLSTGDQKDSKTDASKLGEVISTTLSAANDGIFILTAKPSVWFYRFASDTLAEQTLAYGEWPKSHGIASYGSNLYLLGDASVYKHTRNATGYSPKTDYISTTQSSPKTSSMAVDGYVYLASDAGLQRLLGPVIKQTAETPSKLSPITNLRSAAGGDIIVGVSQKSNRVLVWSSKTDLRLSKQISLKGAGTLRDAVYDQKSGKIFATIDNRFVSLPFKP